MLVLANADIRQHTREKVYMVNLVPEDPNTRLRRTATAAALTAAGFPVSDKTLATKASRGVRAAFSSIWPYPLVSLGGCPGLAELRLTPLRGSTSEFDTSEAVLSDPVATGHNPQPTYCGGAGKHERN